MLMLLIPIVSGSDMYYICVVSEYMLMFLLNNLCLLTMSSMCSIGINVNAYVDLKVFMSTAYV